MKNCITQSLPVPEDLIDVLEKTDFEVLPALVLGTNPVELSIAENTSTSSSRVELLRAKRLMSQRNYRESAEVLKIRVHAEDDSEHQFVQRFALVATGLHGAASGSWSEFESLATSLEVDEAFKERLRARLGSSLCTSVCALGRR